MLALENVLQLPGLGLRPIGELIHPESEVRWAHVSELADPTPWLLGQELILTTGLNIDPSPDACFQYCSRLVNSGVTALGISTGASLPHREVPTQLVAGAKQAGLDLVHVPEDTLLQSVVQQVSDALYQERNTPLIKALATQRELSVAAAGKNGIASVIERLAATVGFSSVVYDDRLRTVASSDPESEQRLLPLKDELRSRLVRGLRWSMTTEDNVESVVALPLGTEGRLRGILVVSKVGVMDTYDRASLAMVVSLLGVLLELRHAQNSHERALYQRVLDSIVSPAISGEEVVARFRESGLNFDRYQVLVVSREAHLENVTALVARLAEFTKEVLVHDGKNEIVLLLCAPDTESNESIALGVEEAECGPAGLGDAVAANRIRLSLKQARFAQTTAESRKLPFLARSEIGGYRALLSMGGTRERQAFTDAVLSEIDDSDRDGKHELFDTLSAFVGTGGNIEQAAEKLGVHRHTVRSRLQKISALSGRDISYAPELFELWLAVELREIGESSLES